MLGLVSEYLGRAPSTAWLGRMIIRKAAMGEIIHLCALAPAPAPQRCSTVGVSNLLVLIIVSAQEVVKRWFRLGVMLALLCQ